MATANKKQAPMTGTKTGQALHDAQLAKKRQKTGGSPQTSEHLAKKAVGPQSAAAYRKMHS